MKIVSLMNKIELFVFPKFHQFESYNFAEPECIPIHLFPNRFRGSYWLNILVYYKRCREFITHSSKVRIVSSDTYRILTELKNSRDE